MIEVFTLVLQMACSFKGTGICPVFDDDRLCLPLKKYLSDYVWRLLLGIEPYIVSYIQCTLLSTEIDESTESILIEHLCAKRLTTFSSNTPNSGTAIILSQTLCQNLESSWRKLSTVNHLQQQISHQTEGLRRSQLLLSAHLWMYEEAIATQAGFAIPTPINRSAILIDLTKITQGLTAAKAATRKMGEEMLVLTTAIAQRLKWAVGANPGLQELMDNFNETIARKCDLVNRTSTLADEAMSECSSVLKYEALRVSTVDALDEDQTFLNLVSRWEKSCMMAQSCSTVVTNVEEALVELLDPEGPICLTWLNNVAALIDDMTDQVQIEVNAIEKTIINSQDEVHSCGYRLRALMATHHRIAMDIRSLLKSTMRYADELQVAAIRDYLKKYKTTLDTISELHGNALSKDFTAEWVRDALLHIDEVIMVVRPMYDDLFSFENSSGGSLEYGGGGGEADGKPNIPAIGQIQQLEASRSNSPSAARSKIQKGLFYYPNWSNE